jgi:hypothetical protein
LPRKNQANAERVNTSEVERAKPCGLQKELCDFGVGRSGTFSSSGASANALSAFD